MQMKKICFKQNTEQFLGVILFIASYEKEWALYTFFSLLPVSEWIYT